MDINESLVKKCRTEGLEKWDNYLEMYPSRIKNLRKAKDSHNTKLEHGLTQKELANILGMHFQNYNRIEVGKLQGGNNMTVETIIRLAVLYGCSADYLLCLTGEDGDHLTGVQVDEDMIEMLTQQNKDLRDALESQKEVNKFLKLENERLKGGVSPPFFYLIQSFIKLRSIISVLVTV